MEEKKTSKWAIAIFVITIITILGYLTGINYSNLVMQIISGLVSIAIICFTYYLKKRAIKKNLGGVKLINFSIYAFIILLVVDIIGSIVLSNYLNNLKNFALNNTPNFFTNDFVGLKENSTENLQKILSYEKETENMKKQFEEIGNIKNCEKLKDSFDIVVYGPYMKFEKINIGIRGDYSVRCYGENKAFDFYASVEYKDKKWFIDDYMLNTDLSKNFDWNDDNTEEIE